MQKYSQLRGVFKLEGNRLGRPYHRLPNMFLSKFEIIESRVGNYFLRKHRSNVNLKKISCEMDVHKKNADLLLSTVGSLAFDIDRPLLLTILNNFYGLEENEGKGNKDLLLTKTEIRLRNRLALDICGMLFTEETLGLPLKLKSDSSNVLSQWAYQITFSLNDEGNSNFYVLLDNAHTDFILNVLRKKDKTKQNEPQANRMEQQKNVVKQIINTLPLSLNVKIAEMGMNVTDLTTIKPGNILPISLPDIFPVFIGQSELFNARLVEDNDRLFISDIVENIHEKSYE